ncbi:MAG: trigger factor [Actinomycetota bacterium]|nr:trigger factor [Actinomycetota bacterium]
MKTSVERVDDTTVKLWVTVEAERVRHAIDDAARKLASEVRVPGFRPGRVPRRVLETRLGKDALVQQAARDAVPGFYAEAVDAESLAVVGRPEFEVGTFDDGREAEFSATVEVRPEIELPDYAGLRVPHPEWEVTDEELAERIDALRERFAELETIDRPLRAGDYAVITVSGERGGRPVEEASAEDLLYPVGDPEESDRELDRNLVGAKAGAILKFRDTLGQPGEGAGEADEVSFTVIVKETKAKRLPEVDDDFALTASEFDTAEELLDDLRSQLQREKLTVARQALRGRVVEAVTDEIDVAVPASLVEQEVQHRLQRLAADARQHGMEFEQFLQAAGTTAEELVSGLQEEARRTVKAQLVVDAVGRAEGIEVTRDDLAAEIGRHAARLGRPPQELAEFMTQPDHIGALAGDAFRRRAIDRLVEQVEVLSAPPEEAVEAESAPAGDAEQPQDPPASG